MKIICQVKQFHAPIQETPEIEGRVKLQSARAGSYITSRAYVNATKKINKVQKLNNFECETCAPGLFMSGAAGNDEMWGATSGGGKCQPSCPRQATLYYWTLPVPSPLYFPVGRFKGQNTHAAEQIGVTGTLYCFWFMGTTYAREKNKWKVGLRMTSGDAFR